MIGEVFVLLPNGERRSMGQIASVTYGGHPWDATNVVVEINQTGSPMPMGPESGRFQVRGTCYLGKPAPKRPSNHYERRMARVAQQRARKRIR